MISRICGKIIAKTDKCLQIDVCGLSYEVLLPQAVMQRLGSSISGEDKIDLITYHYHQIDMNRSTPVLIGFLNEIEKEFFEIFITVSGIGPRAALKALNQPISLIAKAIDEADTSFLQNLPGIGRQRAKEIVAKLQGKVGKFALIKDQTLKKTSASEAVIEDEALAVLMQLEYKKSEAQGMIKKAMEGAGEGEVSSTEELLNRDYRLRKVD
jgi:Holliday junction DNA helicase RuvA